MKSKSDYETIASVFQADIDHDMCMFAEHVEDLETFVEANRHNLIGHVVGMVVVQVYLNQIKRVLEDV